MFLSIPLRNPFAKIISIMSKNRAHQSYLILNYGGFCEIFSQNARNIHAESVSIRKFLRWVLLASERAPASPTSTASPLARASPFTAATKFPLSGKHNFPYTEIFPLQCRVYRKRRCRRFYALTNLLHPYLILIFLLLIMYIPFRRFDIA